jgi:hypothetical protein
MEGNMPGLHKIIPAVNGFVNGLSSVGVKGPFAVPLTAEDGERLGEAVRGQQEVRYVPFAPGDADVFLTATIAGVTFTWPTAERPADL